MSTALQQFDYVLAHFHTRHQPHDGKAQVFCAGHDDQHKESLSIAISDDGRRILLYCHACGKEATPAIVEAAGLTMNDLFIGDGTAWIPRPRPIAPPKAPTPPPQPKAARVRCLARWEYPCLDAAGVLQATKVRSNYLLDDGTIEKSYYWQRPDKGAPGLHGRKVESLPLYGSHLLAALPDGATVVVDEGEKAARSLLDRDIAAVGSVTGAGSTPGRAALAMLAGCDVVLWPDNDTAGRDHMTRIASALIALPEEQRPASVRWLDWPDAPDKGDAADHPGDAAALAALIAAAPVWSLAAPVSGDMSGASDACQAEIARLGAIVAERDRQIAAMTSELIEQDQAIARLERQRASLRQGTRRLAEDNRALLALAHHPRTCKAVGAVWALSKHISRAPTDFTRTYYQDVARDSASSPTTIGRLVGDLEDEGVLEVRRDAIPAADGKPKRTAVHTRLPAAVRAGMQDASRTVTPAAVAIAVVDALPKTRPVSDDGNTHGGADKSGKRRGWCPCCKKTTARRVERRRIERCAECETILDDTLTVETIDIDGTRKNVYYGPPHGLGQADDGMQTDAITTSTDGMQDASRIPDPAMPQLRLLGPFPAICDAPGCDADATVRHGAHDYCATHAQSGEGGYAAAGGG